MNMDTVYYAILLDNKTVLRIAMNSQSLFSVFLSIAPIISFIIITIIAICIAISRMLTKQLLKPIEMMVNNLDKSEYECPFKELEPFFKIIRRQHTEILSAAKARQDFTANVSHELKTPLTAILGYSELLEKDMVDDSNKAHFYKEIKNNSNRLLTLINDIIELSELDRNDYSITFKKVDLYEVAQECMSYLTINAAQKNIDITLSGQSYFIYANKNLIKELIDNLSQNAIQYNNPGGKVLITIKEKDKRPLLAVSDNGIGIPASEQSRVFERFYRVDKSRSKANGGTGLGLAIVKHIVDIHNAKIYVDSAIDVGTTITVCF